MKLLNWLRLTDQHDGQLSLTNLALLVVLVKLGMASEVTLVDAGALFVALLSYQGKKVIAGQAAAPKELRQDMARIVTAHNAAMEKIAELSSKVTAQQVAMGMKDIRR